MHIYFQNKNEAIKKLNAILIDENLSNVAKQANDAWKEHNSLVRGNPVRIYRGEDFKK